MKTRILVLLAATAIATLSFSFVSKKSKDDRNLTKTRVSEAPAGGFVIEEGL